MGSVAEEILADNVSEDMQNVSVAVQQELIPHLEHQMDAARNVTNDTTFLDRLRETLAGVKEEILADNVSEDLQNISLAVQQELLVQLQQQMDAARNVTTIH